VVEGQEIDTRGVTGDHVYWFEARSFENVYFRAEGAAGQILPIRTESQTPDRLFLSKVESRTNSPARLHFESSHRTFVKVSNHPIRARDGEHSAVPRKRKGAIVV